MSSNQERGVHVFMQRSVSPSPNQGSFESKCFSTFCISRLLFVGAELTALMCFALQR